MTLEAVDYAAALRAAGFDAEPYYSGGGIMVVNVIVRRDTPRPVTRGGVPTGELYADALDYLMLGEPTEGEPFGYDVNIDGEYAEESGSVETFQDGDLPATIAWLRDNLQPIIDAARCEDCGNPHGWHLTADQCEAAGIDPGLRDGLGCALYPYVPMRPGMTHGAIGTPVRAVLA